MLKQNIVKISIIIMILIGIASVVYASINNDKSNISGVTITAEEVVVPMPTAIDSNFERQVNLCFIPTAAVYGYTLRISSGFRTLEEQKLLYDQGREVEGHIVTYTLKSLHNFGFAVDVVDRFRGFEINWDRMGKIGAYCGLQQGDEEYDEKVHFQHREGLSIEQFESGMRPSTLELPCSIMETRAFEEKPLTLADLRSCNAPNF